MTPTASRAQAAAFVRDALATWEAVRGMGVVDVNAPPTIHPIAEARFLSALASTHDQGLIDAHYAHRLAEGAVARLTDTAVVAGDGVAWGLNFIHPETGASATDVDVVTTAWVALGLTAVADVLEPCAAPLAESALDALAAWPEATDAPRLPRLWRTRDEPPVLNAALLRVLALSRADRGNPATTEAALAFARASRLPRYGWDFAPGRRSVDMVHSAYVIQALAELDPSPDTARGALDMLNGLRVRGAYRQRLRARRPVVIEEPLAEARSLGEALVACAAQSSTVSDSDIDAALTNHARLLAAESIARFGDPTCQRRADGHVRIKSLAHLTVGLTRVAPMLAS